MPALSEARVAVRTGVGSVYVGPALVAATRVLRDEAEDADGALEPLDLAVTSLHGGTAHLLLVLPEAEDVPEVTHAVGADVLLDGRVLHLHVVVEHPLVGAHFAARLALPRLGVVLQVHFRHVRPECALPVELHITAIAGKLNALVNSSYVIPQT